MLGKAQGKRQSFGADSNTNAQPIRSESVRIAIVCAGVLRTRGFGEMA